MFRDPFNFQKLCFPLTLPICNHRKVQAIKVCLTEVPNLKTNDKSVIMESV